LIYNEKKIDLFSVPNHYCLAHCISSDFAMGKGIAVEFVKRFSMKAKLMAKYKQNTWGGRGYSIYIDGVFNLVTKQYYFNKPTYNTISEAIRDMKNFAVSAGIKRIAMPMIGCGLDRLDWKKVSEIIKAEFCCTDIEILVCVK